MSRYMIFAPHNDDEVLGVGGTMFKLAKAGHDVIVCEVTTGPNPERAERIKKEALKAHDILQVKETVFLDLPMVHLNLVPKPEINVAFLRAVKEFRPEVVFIPHRGDIHIDHQMTAEACMVAVRPVDTPFIKQVYAYETLSESEWSLPTPENIFCANVFSEISEEELERKLEAMACFETQIRPFPQPRSLESIRALARLRGSTVCVQAAEAFKLVRQIF